MEIIKVGKLPEEHKYEVICNNCKTEFRFQQKEAEMVYDQRGGNYLRINCPLCNRIITRGSIGNRWYSHG